MIKKANRTRVKEIFFDGKLNIVWKDEHHSVFNYWDLRTSCPCADCVDELTGEKILDDSKVSKDIHPIKSEYIGNYALRLHWSDNHNTGMFSFEDLRDKLLQATPSQD